MESNANTKNSETHLGASQNILALKQKVKRLLSKLVFEP